MRARALALVLSLGACAAPAPEVLAPSLPPANPTGREAARHAHLLDRRASAREGDPLRWLPGPDDTGRLLEVVGP